MLFDLVPPTNKHTVLVAWHRHPTPANVSSVIITSTLAGWHFRYEGAVRVDHSAYLYWILCKTHCMIQYSHPNWFMFILWMLFGMYYGICTKSCARTVHIIESRCSTSGSTRTKSTYKNQQWQRTAAEKLQNLKLLFQFHHQCPVSLQQIVTEVVLACVNALTRYL